MYVAAECFRYKVTGEADARDNARTRHAGDHAARSDHRDLRASRRARSSRSARTCSRKTANGTTRPTRRGDGRATPAPTRSSATTSSTRSTTTWSRTKPRSRRCARSIERITNHILDNNYQLIDVDGKRTRWGWWGPEAIWEDPDETGLRALHILSHLRVALHMTGNAAVSGAVSAGVRRSDQDAQVSPADAQPEDHGARARSTIPTTSWRSCRTTRCCATRPIPRSSRSTGRASSAAGRSSARSAIRSGTSSTRRAPARRNSIGRESLRTLREIPMDTIQWTVRNSHRLDVPIDPLSDRFKRRQALIVLPYDELPMSKWNGNPYNLDGGNGGRERRRRRVLPAAVLDGPLSQADLTNERRPPPGWGPQEEKRY